MSEKEIAQEGVFDAPEEDDFEVGSSEIEEEYDLEDEDAEMAMDMAEDESDDELGVFEGQPCTFEFHVHNGTRNEVLTFINDMQMSRFMQLIFYLERICWQRVVAMIAPCCSIPGLLSN